MVYENLLVKVSKFNFPVDFVVLEMDEDELVPIILGQPFLAKERDAEEEEEEDSNEVHAVSFYPRTEPVESLEWKALENRLKPSCVEPPKLELKELPEHLEYSFLHENNQLLVVILSTLSTVKKSRLLECPTSKTSKPQHQGGSKKEVIKLLDAGLIYPISDSPWVSPVQVVLKKGGMTVVKNEKGKLIP
ncbi:hypothetical protein Tco_1341009 [Tanacetum coccineum]